MAMNKTLIIIGIMLVVQLSIGSAPLPDCTRGFGPPEKARVVSTPEKDTVIAKVQPRFDFESEDFPGICVDGEGGASCPDMLTGRILLHVMLGSTRCSIVAFEELSELDPCTEYTFLLNAPKNKACTILSVWDGEKLLFDATEAKR